MRGNFVVCFLIILGFLCAATFRLPVACARTHARIDLYTQYSPPCGGQGPDTVSDAFPPDGVVELRANVTLQGDGVPDKPVSYTITAPNGETYSVTSFTQADGITVFEYLLPSSEEYFGMWGVKASVDLTGTIVSDTLYFLMSWLVEVVEVDAPTIAYKGETMGVNITLMRICMQDPRDIMKVLLKYPSGGSITNNDLLLYITVTDELHQPVAMSKLDTSMITELNIYDLDDFVTTISEHWSNRRQTILAKYPELTNVMTNETSISQWSFSGKATIHAIPITNHPGIPCGPEGLGYVWITFQSASARADLDRNDEVNILDVVAVAHAFGGTLDDSYWNGTADLDKNGIINTVDLAMVAKEFGKTVQH